MNSSAARGRPAPMKPLRRLLAAAVLAVALPAGAGAAPAGLQAGDPAAPAPAAAGAGPKVLRYALRIPETSFDPAQILDLYSRIIAANMFEAPLEFEFLARPARLRPNTAAQMPEVSADFKSFTFRIRSGIYFIDDPAFKGKPRELTAQDYVYSIKRHYDPRWKSGNLYLLENARILGLSELRKELMDARKPFDYDRPVEGLQALDRYTFRIRTAVPNPRLPYLLADPSFMGAVAREVVELYGDKVGEHPVGTGPFRLVHWKRSSRMVLERNPGYREVRYDEQAPEGDARRQAIAAQLRGRRLPMVDRVEVSIIAENQPRWLAFLNGEQDLIEEVPADFAGIAMPGNRLAPNLARQGIQMVRYPRVDVAFSYFDMNDPVVGGYEPHKVALRRAISLAVDLDKEIRLVRGGQAVPAQSPVGPGAWGYDPAFKSEMSEFDLPRAKALLDMHGYVDRDGDGWREQPDGSPLLLRYSSQPDQLNRQLIEQWQNNMNAVGIRIEFRIAQWPENLKSARAGKLMMWGVSWSLTQPDADGFLGLGYGPNRGQANLSRFDLPAYNDLYVQQRQLPDGPERNLLIDEAKKLLIAYMPYKAHVHRIWTDMAHPWVQGYDRNVFVREFWKYVDMDPQELKRHAR
jgi:ABC-type transport system substrate-binding protein